MSERAIIPINELKSAYKKFLLTPRGKAWVRDAVMMRKMWLSTPHDTYTFGTKCVNLSFIPELSDYITLIDIIPIGLNNCCHSNASWFSRELKGMTEVIGFNITSCPCGRYISFEPHTVNKYQNKLFDFTRDFADEKSKYFLELNCEMNSQAYYCMYGDKPIFVNRGCVCNVKWVKEAYIYKKSYESFKNMIKMIEKVRCLNWN